jgi:hypothetical protein
MEDIMKLSAPKNVTFYIAVLLALIALIGFFVGAMSAFAPWIMLAAFVLLALGNLLEGL